MIHVGGINYGSGMRARPRQRVLGTARAERTVTGLHIITVTPGYSESDNLGDREMVNGHEYTLVKQWSVHEEILEGELEKRYLSVRGGLLTTPDTSLNMTGISYDSGDVEFDIKTKRTIK